MAMERTGSISLRCGGTCACYAEAMATSRPARAGDADAASAILQPLGTALLVVALLLGFALLPKLFSEHAALSGKPAPEFSVEAVANSPDKPRLALSDLRGKVV